MFHNPVQTIALHVVDPIPSPWPTAGILPQVHDTLWWTTFSSIPMRRNLPRERRNERTVREVSILIATVGAVGRYLGVLPR
jgi:hypothetical protein